MMFSGSELDVSFSLPYICLVVSVLLLLLVGVSVAQWDEALLS